MASPIVIECFTDEPRLCVIADGLGGHTGGEVASALAVRELFAAVSGFSGPESIAAALQAINKRLYEVMQTSPQLRGMGTTLVGLAAFGSNLCLFNVGDSRAYVSIGDYLRLLSIDDSVGAAMSDTSACTGLHTHGILQSLGGLSSFTPN